MAKDNRRGQAKIWTPYAIGKMRKNLNSPAQKLAFEISLLTGERMGAITQLQVNDIYDEQGKLLEQITFRGETRKSTRWGQAKTRKVYLNPMNERVFVKLPSAKNWLSFSITMFTHQGISQLKQSIAKARGIFIYVERYFFGLGKISDYRVGSGHPIVGDLHTNQFLIHV